ncbi:MAG: response regulator [Bacteroidales bacterium]|jgi:CheY-like chemotaxis protein|nr:response regulator [Bacteroidales bacterium]
MKDTCQLNSFLKGLKPEYSKQIVASGKRIMFLPDEKNFLPEMTVEIDCDIVRKILDVLVGNSVKYTDKGYIKVGYRVLDKLLLQLFVEDTGAGIQPATLEELNRKLSENDSLYGAEIRNLSDVGKLIRAVGGTIRIESQKDMGTTIYFNVPYRSVGTAGKDEETEAAGDVPVEAAQKSKVNEKNDIWKGKTILIAEDEIVNYMFLEVLFEETGATLIHAPDGQQAIDAVKTHPEINLILMDIKMPYVNGLEATKAIKAMRPQVPVIAQTAYAMQDDEYKALQAGCNEYISKPIDANKLLGMMKKYIYQ